MRHRRHASALAAALTVTTVMCGSAALPAQAAPQPDPLAAALRRDVQLDPTDFAKQSDVAAALSSFTSIARATYPDTFGGSWLEGLTPVVAVAPGAPDLRDAATARGFTVREVAVPERQLRDALNAATSWLDGLDAATAATVRGAFLDVARNAVTIAVKAGATLVPPASLTPIRVAADVADIDADTTAATTVAQTDSPAGTGFAATADPGVNGDAAALRCSLGFDAVDARGGAVNITAGHCDPDPVRDGSAHAASAHYLTGSTIGDRFGTFVGSQTNGVDYSVIAVDPAQASSFSEPAFTGTADPVVGMTVCKLGTTTGYTCGVVTATDQRAIVDTGRVIVGGFASSMCALGGDSGGPIFSGTLAVGIASASNAASYGNCTLASVALGIRGQAPAVYATPISAVLAENPQLRLL